MGSFLLTDLGIVCLVFWGAIGAFLIWYAWKLKEFKLGQDTDQQLEQNWNEKKSLLFEALQTDEAKNFFDNLDSSKLPETEKEDKNDDNDAND